MIRIGIIGDVGSGKSYIAKQFGFPVFNADLEVNKIYKKNKKCFNKLKRVFPNYIFSFPIKRKEIFRAVLENKKNIKKINKIVHPEVRFRMYKFINKNKNKKAIVLDIPLLLENNINKKNDVLVFIEAKKKKKKKKLKKKPKIKKKKFKKIKKLQLPLETKRKKSNFVIKNNFKSLSTSKNVKILKNKILRK